MWTGHPELLNNLSVRGHHAGEVTHSSSVSTLLLISDNLYPNPPPLPNYRNTKNATEIKHSKNRKARFKSYSEKNRDLQRCFTKHEVLVFQQRKSNLLYCTARTRHRKNPVIKKKRLFHEKLVLVLLDKCVANEAVTVRRKRKASSL